MEVTEEIIRLLRQGKNPRELIEMGYARSTVYYALRKLREEESRRKLLEVAKDILQKRRGSLEIAIGRLVLEALLENDHLRIIDRVCRAYQMLDDEEKLSLLPKDDIEEFDRICLICTSLLNAYECKDEDIHVFHVLIPIPGNELKKYVKFLTKDPESLKYVTWHYPDSDERKNTSSEYEALRKFMKDEDLKNIKIDTKPKRKNLKDRLFLNILPHSYYALVTYFVTYALPIAMKALRRLIDVIDPREFKEVVLRGGAMVKREGEVKLQKA